MMKKHGQGKWYVLWLVMVIIFSGCICMLSRYSVVATEVLEGKEYMDSSLFEKALEYEKQELQEYFRLRSMITTNEGGIDENANFLDVCGGYTNGYEWNLGELCDVSNPGEEYQKQLKQAEKEFWKSQCDMDNLFPMYRHLINDGVIFYDYGRLYEIKDRQADDNYVETVKEILGKNAFSDVKFTNIGQGCYRLDALPVGENMEELRKKVYDMRTVQSLSKYIVQIYEYYTKKFENRNSNFSYRFVEGYLDLRYSIETYYLGDNESGDANVIFSTVSYDGIYHTRAYGLDENLAKELLLPTVVRKYEDEGSGEQYHGYIALDTAFEKEDAFYYGKALYEEASGRVLPLLIMAVISFLCCMGTGIFIVLGWRRRYLVLRQQEGGERKERRSFTGKFELQLLLCIVSFAGVPAMIFFYWHTDNTGMLSDKEKFLYFAGIIAVAVLSAVFLNWFIYSTICDSVKKRSIILNLRNKVNSVYSWMGEKYFSFSSHLRYGICIISICLWFVAIASLCACGWIYKKQEFMLWAAVCMAAGVFLLIRNMRSGYRKDKFYREVLEGVKRISGGELTYQMTGEYSYREQEMVDAINQIAIGLQRAVEEQIKSERTKTRLITNVSHDIKTPLTSVINYIGLLKQEKLEGGRTREYLDVLDMKSQRLKVLIEDLIEASKISSGAIELHKNTWNLGEFLGQVTGEFADRFAERELELVSTIPDAPVMVWADSQRIFRVMENLYVNIYKYAMPRTRVYLEVRQENQAIVILRNSSEQRVEINPEELTERFVRGEESRSSDGSGLGLSIAKSLLELHGGSITISTEADLFRVKVTLPLAQDKEES